MEEISSSQDIPEELVSLALHQVTWPNHPLGWDVAGTPDSVQNLSRENLSQFLLHHYGPHNTVIGVAGDVDHGQVVELAGRLLGNWRAGRAGLSGRAGQPRRAAGDLDQQKVEQTHLALHLPVSTRSWRPLRAEPAERYSGRGNDSTSSENIARLGLAYAVTSLSQLADAGVTGVYTAVARYTRWRR